MWTDNPLADYHRYSSMQEDRLSRLPICCKCDEHIQEDVYEVDGEFYDYECLKDFHSKEAPHNVYCSECGKLLQEEGYEGEFAYCFDGEWICDECMEENHKN